MRQTYHQWVSVNIFEEHTSKIWKRSRVKTFYTFSSIDVSNHCKLMLLSRLCLPLYLDWLQRLLQGETYDAPRYAYSCTHQDNFGGHNLLFRLFLFTFRLLLSFHFSIITILIGINIYLLKMKSIGSFKKSFLRQLINQKRAFSNNINEGKQEYKVDEKEIFSE